MDTVDVPFGEFLPSVPAYQNPGCLIADNCYPAPGGGYRPFFDYREGAESYTGDCMGATLFFKGSTPFIAGGTATTLFTRDGITADSDTGYTTVPADEAWDFAQFGKYIIATSSTNAPQYLADYTSGTTWAALTGSPPTGRFVERVGDFLFIGNLSTASNGIAWSAFNNPTGAWAASRLTQAGSAELPKEYGEIMGIVGGRYALIFQERAISLLQYVGPPTVWKRDEISVDRGAIASGSIVSVGFNTAFLASDGFWMTNGSDFQPIGAGKVNKWFFETCAQGLVARTHGTVDHQNECFVWAFVSNESSTFDRLLIYSWAEDRWSTATVGVQRLVGSRRDGVTLEDLDALFPGGLEDVTPSLDDAFWQAGERILAAFVNDGTDTTYATFAGDTLAAEWQTGAFQPQPGRRATVTGFYPLFDAPDWTMEAAPVAYDNNRNPMVGAYTSVGAAGYCPAKADGLMLGAACRTVAGDYWNVARGLQARFRASGGR